MHAVVAKSFSCVTGQVTKDTTEGKAAQLFMEFYDKVDKITDHMGLMVPFTQKPAALGSEYKQHGPGNSQEGNSKCGWLAQKMFDQKAMGGPGGADNNPSGQEIYDTEFEEEYSKDYPAPAQAAAAEERFYRDEDC